MGKLDTVGDSLIHLLAESETKRSIPLSCMNVKPPPLSFT